MHTIITHDGAFHPDDVLAVATLRRLLGAENTTIVRTRDQAIIATGDYVVDVGAEYDPERQRFDHHQVGAPRRSEVFPYASFGLVWKQYGATICGSVEVADEIEQQLVLPVDLGDNGEDYFTTRYEEVLPFEINDVVSAYLPVWGGEESFDEQFLHAVVALEQLLARLIMRTSGKLAMRACVQAVYSQTKDKRVLVFDRPVSPSALIAYPDVFAIVVPESADVNSKWCLVTIRKALDTFEPRALLPEAWAGLRDEELQTVSGYPDAGFAHLKRFFFVADSKETVEQVARDHLTFK